MFGSFLVALALVAGACGRADPAPETKPGKTSIGRVDWTDTARSVDLGGGWAVRGCPDKRPKLCVEHDKALVGHVRLEDVPTLGEEKTSSSDQVQAVLAARIHTDYRSFRQQRQQQCGPAYEIRTARPSPVVVAGEPGLRYGATGAVARQIMEKTVGYRVFRQGIESLIEATAISPGGCLTPETPGFSIEQLGSFQKVFDRLVAGSRLPAATRFPEPSDTVPAGNVDPRTRRIPENGIGIVHEAR
jgi:hypothetical protein